MDTDSLLAADSPGVHPATLLAQEQLRELQSFSASLIPDSPLSENSINTKQVAYWRFCIRPGCVMPGHADRHREIVIGPSQKGPGGRDQCTDHEGVTHGESLEGIYGSWGINHADLPGPRHVELDPSHPFGPYENLVLHSLGTGLSEFPIRQFINLGWQKMPQVLRLRPDVQEWIAAGNLSTCTDHPAKQYYDRRSLAHHRKAEHAHELQALANSKEFGHAILPLKDALEAAVSGNSGNSDMAAAMALLAEVVAQNQQLLAAQAKN